MRRGKQNDIVTMNLYRSHTVQITYYTDHLLYTAPTPTVQSTNLVRSEYPAQLGEEGLLGRILPRRTRHEECVGHSDG